MRGGLKWREVKSLPETFEAIRRFLGWSFKELAGRMGNSYSEAYLKMVHQGRPLPEVEEKLIQTYIQGLAEQAVDSVFGLKVPQAIKTRLVANFSYVIRSSQLRLKDVITLAERASSIKIPVSEFRDPDAMVLEDLRVWEEALEGIALDLIGGSIQGQLFRDYVPYKVVIRYVEECWFCHLASPGNQCRRCSKNQNIPD